MNRAKRGGYTLIEILVSVTLMLLLMLGVTQLFSSIGTTINEAQSTLNMTANLRATKNRLAKDLTYLTADPFLTPLIDTATNPTGYFCIIEGMGAAHSNTLLQNLNAKTPTSDSIRTRDIALNPDSNDAPLSALGDTTIYDNTVGDMDDVIMFTVTSPAGEEFRGLCGTTKGIIESNTAEVIWFCRGNTLYRRTLLVIPDDDLQASGTFTATGFYAKHDISARYDTVKSKIVANTLEDLTRRENRFAHGGGLTFPCDIHDNAACYYLRMPTLTEMSHTDWNIANTFLVNINGKASYPSTTAPYSLYTDPLTASSTPFIDFWYNPLPWQQITPTTGNIYALESTTRYAEDVILTNVLSFDVQVWNPEVNRFANLGEARNYTAIGSTIPSPGLYYEDLGPDGNQIPADATALSLGTQGFYSWGQKNVVTNAIEELPCVYDTWTDEYEVDRKSVVGYPTNGRNPNSSDFRDWSAPQPYWVGLRGVKVTIRTFDPRSRNVREMSLVHSFVPK